MAFLGDNKKKIYNRITMLNYTMFMVNEKIEEVVEDFNPAIQPSKKYVFWIKFLIYFFAFMFFWGLVDFVASIVNIFI